MDCMKKRKRGLQVIDVVVFAVLLVIASAFGLWLFYNQAQYPEIYSSDINWYIKEIQGMETGLKFPYPIYFRMSAVIALFTSTEFAAALSAMLLNSLSILVTKLAWNRILLLSLEKNAESWTDRKKMNVQCITCIMVSLLTVSLFFISMLYLPSGQKLPGIDYKYLGVFTPTPFHNATYIAARPFAILAFLWFVKLLARYEKGVSTHGYKKEAGLVDYIFFSLFLLLATMTKPSFTLAFVSTAGLLMLYRLFRSGFRNFISTMMLGLCFVPTFVDLLYQFHYVYVDGGDGLRFGPGEVWMEYTENIPLAIVLAVAFPISVLVLNWKQFRKNTLLGFSWQFFLISFAEAFFLYEEGAKKLQFNFAWGYMYGIFFCHFASLITLSQATIQRIIKVNGDYTKNNILLVLQWFIYLCHLICGVIYFRDLCMGEMYF